MTTYVQNFLKFQPLLKELIARDIKVKYRKSVLGVLWTLLNPLFMMIVLSVVFSNLFKFDVEYFPVYLLSGQLIFNFYSEVTTCSMSAIIDNGPLIKKVYTWKDLLIHYQGFRYSVLQEKYHLSSTSQNKNRNFWDFARQHVLPEQQKCFP